MVPLAYLLLRALGSPAGFFSLVRLRSLELVGATVLIALLVTVLAGVLGLGLAWLLARARLPLRRLWLVILTAPIVIPSYVSAFALIAILAPHGPLASTWVGGIESWGELRGLPGAVIALTSICYPYVMLPALAAFHRLNPQLEEAAQVHGLGPGATFRRVALPLVAPSAAAGMLIVALYAIGDFGAVSLMNYDSVASAIYARYEYSLDRSAAAWYSLLLVIGAFGLVYLERWVRRRRPVGWDAAADLRPVEPIALGAWHWPAVGFMALVALVALGLPVMMLLYWTSAGGADGVDAGRLAGQAAGTLGVAGGTAVLAAMLALPIAWLALRRPSMLTQIAGGAAAINWAIPGIALGLSLVLLASRYTPWIYQTFVLLIFGYFLHSLPLALGSVRSSLSQVGEQLEDAARMLGKPLAVTLWKVTVPLVRPGLLAGAGLVLLATMKELPITLLLSPTGFKTLAVEVWSAADAGQLGVAGPAGLLLLVLALPQIALVLAGLRR